MDRAITQPSGAPLPAAPTQPPFVARTEVPLRRHTRLLGLCLVSALLIQCGGSGSDLDLPSNVVRVEISGPSRTAPGATVAFSAVAYDDAGEALTSGVTYTWSSGQPGIATVDRATGVATGVAAGTAAIRVNAASEGQGEGVQAEEQLTVENLASLELAPESRTIAVGLQNYFLASALYADGNEANVGILWTSSDNSIAEIIANEVNPVQVRGASPGTATITATTKTNPSQTATAQVIVVAASGQVTGVVIDAETQQPIANATVIFSAPNIDNLGQTVTRADGTYTSPELGNILTLHITAQATGYVSATLHTFGVPPGETVTAEPIPLVHQSASPGGISGTVRNARTNDVVPDAIVELFPGLGGGANLEPKQGQISTDASGAFAFSPIPAGTYELFVHASGFADGRRSGIAVGNGGTTPNQDVIVSPAGSQDVRVVLTWGSNPSDLDAHLTGPNADGSRFHVFWEDRGGFDAAPFAGLDVDDISSFGPETITITRLNSGVYRYSVHDYTNRSSASSTALGASGAKVELYVNGSLNGTFFVPNQAGTLWTVFELSGDIGNPAVTAVNSMGFAEDPISILDRHRAPGSVAIDAEVIGRSAFAHAKGQTR